jgi:DNA-3-methyladenine glycosylase
MFARGGLAYIYLIYGMYYCFNIVTAAEENPHAVLIRAVEPVSGLELIKSFKTMQDNYIFCSI